MLQHVLGASTETSPSNVDHRKAANPYLSKFGPDVWEEKNRGSQTFSNAICIREYIDHMMVASAKVTKGTEFENNWFFYHDALLLMTSNTTKDWMREKRLLS